MALPADLRAFFVPENIEREVGQYYVSKHILGEGGSSVVKLAWHKAQNKPAAAKIVAKSKLTERGRENLERELQIHSFISKFNHKNICNLYEVIETSQHYYIFLEYVKNGDLVTYIEELKRIPEDEAKVLFRQIIEAIAFLHNHSIVHRDIKAENFLVVKPESASNGTTTDGNGHSAKNAPLLKLTDFGLADWIQGSKCFSTPCGSPVYTAPEVVDKTSYRGEPTDIWSAGILLYTMLVGEFPFSHPNIAGLFDQIRRGQYTVPVFVSDEAKDLISRMLARDASARLTVEQVLEHPWLREKDDHITDRLPPGWV